MLPPASAPEIRKPRSEPRSWLFCVWGGRFGSDGLFVALPVWIPQLALVQLPVGRAGHGLDEIERSRALELGKFLAAVNVEFLGQPLEVRSTCGRPA